MGDKQKQLDEVAREIKEFKGIEIAKNATNAVPGEGDSESELMFIGEAPGFHEDQQGRPFVGLAGKLLEKSLGEIGLARNDVYITNIVKYRPPDNRDPLPEEIDACKDWLDRQIMIISPKIIVTLGRFSMAKFMGPQSISKIHGQHRQISFRPDVGGELNVIVYPMFHPAAALRGTTVMNIFKEDFHKLKKLLNEEEKAEPVIEPVKTEKKPKQESLF